MARANRRWFFAVYAETLTRNEFASLTDEASHELNVFVVDFLSFEEVSTASSGVRIRRLVLRVGYHLAVLFSDLLSSFLRAVQTRFAFVNSCYFVKCFCAECWSAHQGQIFQIVAFWREVIFPAARSVIGCWVPSAVGACEDSPPCDCCAVGRIRSVAAFFAFFTPLTG